MKHLSHLVAGLKNRIAHHQWGIRKGQKYEYFVHFGGETFFTEPRVTDRNISRQEMDSSVMDAVLDMVDSTNIPYDELD